MAGKPGYGGTPRGQAQDDLYTVMAIIATGCVALALGYVIYKAIELHGTIPSFAL